MRGEWEKTVYLKRNLFSFFIQLNRRILSSQDNPMDILCDDDLGHLHPLLFKKEYLEFEGISIRSLTGSFWPRPVQFDAERTILRD
jgi:hypothetical protein